MKQTKAPPHTGVGGETEGERNVDKVVKKKKKKEKLFSPNEGEVKKALVGAATDEEEHIEEDTEEGGEGKDECVIVGRIIDCEVIVGMVNDDKCTSGWVATSSDSVLLYAILLFNRVPINVFFFEKMKHHH